MKKKGNLVQLIKSLTESEKKHFISNVQRTNGSTNYLELFYFIAQSEQVDDYTIREYFNGAKFLKQLHVAKNYLYNQILKSLRHFHGGHSINIKIKNHLIDVEVLYKRELYHQCHYELVKAKKLATKYEKSEVLLEISKWEKLLLQSPVDEKSRLPDMSSIISTDRNHIDNISNYNKYLDLSYNTLSFGYQPERLTEIQESGVVGRDVTNAPLSTKVMHYHILYVYETFSGNTRAGIEAITKLVIEVEKFPHRISEDPKPYITAINNKIGALLYLKEHNEIPNMLNKIRNIPSAYNIPLDNYLRRTMARSYNMEMELYRDTGQTQKGVDLIPNILIFLNDNMDMLPDEYIINLYYQFAYMHFVANSYSSALKYTNEIINRNLGDIRQDMQGYARLLNLILHYELRNITVLKYAVQSTRRFLQKKKELYSFEKNILKIFSKLCTSPMAEHRPVFQGAYSDVFSNTDESEILSILDYLNFKEWFEKNS